jgi:hypothetical protein
MELLVLCYLLLYFLRNSIDLALKMLEQPSRNPQSSSRRVFRQSKFCHGERTLLPLVKIAEHHLGNAIEVGLYLESWLG